MWVQFCVFSTASLALMEFGLLSLKTFAHSQLTIFISWNFLIRMKKGTLWSQEFWTLLGTESIFGS